MPKKILGIIVARGGSKSIPRKNIKPFAGKPLIAWSIAAALKSEVLDRLIVSTDDEEIAGISKEYGAEIPFMRPPELAQDTTPTLSVLQHAVSFLKDDDYVPDYVLLLEPTAPLRQPFHIQEAVKMLNDGDPDSVVSLGEVPKHYHPAWQFNLNNEGGVSLFAGGDIKNIVKRRQDLSATYYRNGALYLFKTNLLFAANPSLYGDKVRGYIMEDKYSADIDTIADWEYAERHSNLLN